MTTIERIQLVAADLGFDAFPMQNYAAIELYPAWYTVPGAKDNIEATRSRHGAIFYAAAAKATDPELRDLIRRPPLVEVKCEKCGHGVLEPRK